MKNKVSQQGTGSSRDSLAKGMTLILGVLGLWGFFAPEARGQTGKVQIKIVTAQQCNHSGKIIPLPGIKVEFFKSFNNPPLHTATTGGDGTTAMELEYPPYYWGVRALMPAGLSSNHGFYDFNLYSKGKSIGSPAGGVVTLPEGAVGEGTPDEFQFVLWDCSSAAIPTCSPAVVHVWESIWPGISLFGGGPLNLQDAFILGVQTGFTEVVTLHNADIGYLVQQVFPTMPSYAVALGLPRDNLDALIAQLSAGVASRQAYPNLAFGLGLPRSGLHALGGQRSSGVGSGQAYASVMSVRNQFYQQLNRNCSCGNVVNLAAMFQAGELMGSAEMLAFLNGDPKELAATLANAKQFAAAAGLPTDGLDVVSAHLQAGANPCDLAQELQTIEKQFEQVTNQACTCMYEAAKDVLGTRWDETESGHHGVWSRRGNSNVFDGNIDGVTTEMTITIAGNSVNVARRKSSDGNDCNYRGTLSGDARSVKGTYVCKNGGPYTWEATITR